MRNRIAIGVPEVIPTNSGVFLVNTLQDRALTGLIWQFSDKVTRTYCHGGLLEAAGSLRSSFSGGGLKSRNSGSGWSATVVTHVILLASGNLAHAQRPEKVWSVDLSHVGLGEVSSALGLYGL